MADPGGHRPAEVLAGCAVLLLAFAFLAYAVARGGGAAVGGDGLVLHAEFDDIGGLAPGSDVRMAGVKVGRVLRTGFDAKTYRARVDFTAPRGIPLPDDSSAQIASAGLLGGVSLSLVPGGSETLLRDGGAVRVTQSAANLESLLGKFVFNVGALADASREQLRRGRSGGSPPAAGAPE